MIRTLTRKSLHLRSQSGAHVLACIVLQSHTLLGREAIHPSPMTAEERLDEVARLLALGYLRLRARRQRKKPMIRTT